MHCQHLKLPNGAHAIVCGPRPRRRTCSACGTPRSATRQCDWIIAKATSDHEKCSPAKTCDAWLCERCTHEPAADKDLCPTHAAHWARRRVASKPVEKQEVVP